MAESYPFDPRATSSGNVLRVLCDGREIFTAIHRAISSAAKQIALEIYMFEGDATGRRVLRDLVEAARRGCKVRVIYDGIGSLWTRDSFFDPLLKAGGEVFVYHPPLPWVPGWGVKHRDHRKMLLVDDHWVLIGGMNIAAEYERLPGEGGFHDLAVEVQGPASAQAWNLFERTWKRRSRASVEPKPRPIPIPEPGAPFAEIVGNGRFRDRWRIRRRILYAIRQAEESIDIVNPYFLPDPGLIRALRDAVRRGVRVRVIVPRASDVPIVDLASMVAQRKLIRREVAVYIWPGIVHAKAVSIDRTWLCIGTYNFDHLSLFNNLEVVVNALDHGAGEQLGSILERDVTLGTRLTEEYFLRLPWWTRIGARLFYRLRTFL
ncbi:MAG TPA: phosphatidylserine/phosphatidylglycerophosphate/cardiolipin synthase family protein [Bdellovibrionota bacterium]|nr:phosphatidylserine/phosphatidylglycerophosphate/cardiolipin synthase family protein [Bdellovibrionota bacterium]